LKPVVTILFQNLIDKMELLARVRSLLKVKDYNDLMLNYRKELEAEVTSQDRGIKAGL
jgi:putative two-component system response regulator